MTDSVHQLGNIYVGIWSGEAFNDGATCVMSRKRDKASAAKFGLPGICFSAN